MGLNGLSFVMDDSSLPANRQVHLQLWRSLLAAGMLVVGLPGPITEANGERRVDGPADPGREHDFDDVHDPSLWIQGTTPNGGFSLRSDLIPVDDDLGDHCHDTDARHEEDEGVEVLVHDCDDGPSESAEDETDDGSDDESLGCPRPDHTKKKHDTHDYKKRHDLLSL